MRNRFVWFFCIAAIASNAFASSSELAGISVGELGKVQSETILLKAKAERAKAEQQITQGNQTIAVQPTSSGLGGTLPQAQLMQYMPPQTSTSNQLVLPVIKEVTGSARKLQATLLYSSGIEIDAATGSDLPDGFRVVQITLDGVTLERKNKRFPLGFSNQAPPMANHQSPAMPQPSAGLPGLIPTRP
ncbi:MULTISPECIES: type IV pilus biogenesis protein PilP [Pseudomonas]|uniref:type IV pilus biogenesis protein PilP n=1 Tax=Pseudomonas TaxID=286 RepID=UPI000F55B507|nr:MULTISPECIES: type IV pilus biogenesis protein PilP [Pseudomonas]AZC83956.1 Conjugative transfer protein PilP in PFGI-1-like cluster [Pseudomonas chlororaphis subsp. piscium]WJV24492.1 type IV pilus biogenesis protein PilP [Pseudomonas chlororaphis]